MKTPVIIAAHNEVATLPHLLRHLDREFVDPIVVANGCVDNTAEIARSYGTQCHELDQIGKLPAQQHAVKVLASSALSSAVAFIDADSRPLFSTNMWIQSMESSLRDQESMVVFGPICYMSDADFLSNAIRNCMRRLQVLRAASTDTTQTFEANMMLKFGNNEVLDDFLALPHIWQKEGKAIEDVFLLHGGASVQNIGIRSLVRTSGRSLPPLRITTNERQQQSQASYINRAAPGSISYDQARDRQLLPGVVKV